MRRARKSSGSIILLAVMLLGGIIGLFMVFMSVNGLLMARNSSQRETDSLALNFAECINQNDRVGQINEIEACSRELVFNSRKRMTDCQHNDLENLTPLCNRLLMEARQGAQLVEAERQNQVQLICTQIKNAAAKHNDEASSQSNFSLAMVQTRKPIVTRIDVGRIANVESNVKRLGVVEELSQFDARNGYVNSKSQLFKADLNAKLPSEDADLNFFVSSLPARVGDTCSPARNVNPDVFIRTGTIYGQDGGKSAGVAQIPDAIQITCTMDTSLCGQNGQSGALELVSTSAATGGVAGTSR